MKSKELDRYAKVAYEASWRRHHDDSDVMPDFKKFTSEQKRRWRDVAMAVLLEFGVNVHDG